MAEVGGTSQRYDMPNLTKLLTIVAMTTGLGLTACKTEPAKTQETPVAKPAENPPTEAKPTEAKPTEAKPTEAKPADTQAQPTTAGDLPAECAAYKAGIEKLATCDKLPQDARTSLKQAYEASSSAWASVPADGKAALAAACKSAADALKQTAAACE